MDVMDFHNPPNPSLMYRFFHDGSLFVVVGRVDPVSIKLGVESFSFCLSKAEDEGVVG